MTMLLFSVTYDDAERTLLELAAERPDFIYPGTNCVYVKDNKPSCLIGCMLARLGMPIEALASLDPTNSDVTMQSAVAWLIDYDVIEVDTPRTASLLRTAQFCQDEHKEWQVAVSRAIDEARTIKSVYHNDN